MSEPSSEQRENAKGLEPGAWTAFDHCMADLGSGVRMTYRSAGAGEAAEANKALAARRLTKPVLGVGGEASAACWVAEGLKAVAENVEAYMVPGAGHWLGDENPRASAASLLRIFAGDGDPA